jgi:hypothetical protein
MLRVRSLDRNVPSTVPSLGSIFPNQCYPSCVLLIFATRGPRLLTLTWCLATVLAFLLLLFSFAIRRHAKGQKDVWFSPVNALDWSSHDSKKASKLPAPVTARRTRSQSKPPAPAAPRRHVSEKRTHAPRPSQSRQPQMAYIPDRREPRSRTTDRYRPDYYRRDASPRR